MLKLTRLLFLFDYTRLPLRHFPVSPPACCQTLNKERPSRSASPAVMLGGYGAVRKRKSQRRFCSAPTNPTDTPNRRQTSRLSDTIYCREAELCSQRRTINYTQRPAVSTLFIIIIETFFFQISIRYQMVVYFGILLSFLISSIVWNRTSIILQ